MNHDSVIKISNLTKTFGKVTAVDKINLEVKQGDFFGFVGPNGAGKSTTINCLLNFLFPTEGDMTILGLDCIKDSVELKKYIGFVPAEVFYYENMTVKELLNYSNSFYNGLEVKLIKKYIKMFAIPLDKKMGELSSGNKKKVAIIQSLLHKPQLLILDEPSNGLDPLMQANLFNVLEEIRKDGTTIFMSSHVLKEVQNHCNRVAFIKDGKIIKTGLINNIIKKNMKLVKITTNDINDLKKNLKVKDLENIIIRGNTISFIYRNTPRQLLKELAGYDIIDISIETPDLEDIFMDFYKGGK